MTAMYRNVHPGLAKDESILPSKLSLPHLLHLQTNVAGKNRVMVFQTKGDSYGLNEPYVAVLIHGDAEGTKQPLVRIHSRCLFAEVFHSDECDCAGQLDETWRRFKREKNGILIYLEQEGRGSGAFTKAAAYELNESKGVDTVDAYRELGRKVDSRNFYAAADVLKYLGVKSVRLLTNNPRKVMDLEKSGIRVKRNPLVIPPTRDTVGYMKIKQFKLGQDMGFSIT